MLEQIEAERQLDDTEKSSSEEKIISDIKVDDSMYVRYKTLNGDRWVRHCRLKEVCENELNIQSDKLEEDYNSLQSTVASVYDDERDMWRVEYSTNEDDDMESLYVPLDSPFTDDINIYNLFDENGKPKKEELKKIPIKLPKLKTKDLYVDSIKGEKELRTDVEVTYDSKFKEALTRIYLSEDPQVFLYFTSSLFLLSAFIHSLFVAVYLAFSLLVHMLYFMIAADEHVPNRPDFTELLLLYPLIGEMKILKEFNDEYQTITEEQLKNIKSTKLLELD